MSTPLRDLLHPQELLANAITDTIAKQRRILIVGTRAGNLPSWVADQPLILLWPSDGPEMEKEYFVQHRLVRSALFQLDTMEVLVSLLASGACEKYPDFNFVLGESGVTWLPYVFDRLDTEYHDRARSLGFKMRPSDYFRRQGYVTYQQDKYLEPIVPLIGEDNIIWGADYPHPDCIWPNSRETLANNLASFSPAVQKKIVHDNVARLYGLN